MELFKTAYLKNKYKKFTEKLLPTVLECGYCDKSHCQLHGRFDISCIHCKKIKCNNCFKFNISKDILLKAGDEETVDYLINFISDFLNLSNESIQKYFPNIKIVRKEKIHFKKSYVKSQKNRSQVVSCQIPAGTRAGTFQNGKWKRRFFY